MKKKILLTAVLSLTFIFVAGCSNQSQTGEKASNSTESKETSTEKSKEEAKGEEHLDYDDQENWEFTAGKMQSPIDIPTDKAKALTEDSGTITLDYNTNITKAENNGHSIEVTDGGKALINGRNFTLAQFHFHAESEHTVDGKHYPVEAHFVNKAEDGRIAVIGVFFKEGAENQGFQEVLDDVSNDSTDPITNITTMLPENKSYYHYLGSLTTPPLIENVEWYVMTNPVEVSSKQIEDFKKLYSHNNRKIQPLNDRTIIEHKE